jgi:hypothetical protein
MVPPKDLKRHVTMQVRLCWTELVVLQLKLQLTEHNNHLEWALEIVVF